ncbi:MAG: hypothetical protein R2749_04025 [Acidimicrobiales bacterium]
MHAPHHIDMRIPFYRPPWPEELAARYGDDVVAYRFKPSTVRHIFRSCQLFDFRPRRVAPLHTAERRGGPRHPAAARGPQVEAPSPHWTSGAVAAADLPKA